MEDRIENSGESFSDDELFDYVDGRLEEQRKKELEAQLAVDEEFRAKLGVLRYILSMTEDSNGE